jgi:hypothetical protein
MRVAEWRTLMSLTLVRTSSSSVAAVTLPPGLISGVEACIYAVNLSNEIDG